MTGRTACVCVCVPRVCLAGTVLHRTLTATFRSATVLRFIRSLDMMDLICAVCACTHAWIHASMRTCAWNACVEYRCRACKHTWEYTCVCQWSPCISQPTRKVHECLWGASESVHVCWFVLLCRCVQCFRSAGICPLPSPSSGWCSTSAQLLSSTQWLL